MPLSHKPPFPPSRAFVVKLRDDCHPAQGSWRGRLENMASGRQREFDSADQLLNGLAAMTPQPDKGPPVDPADPQATHRGDRDE
jgi:hypothetical protein